MSDSDFVVHFTKGDGDKPYENLVKMLEEKTLKASSIPWTENPAVCFTECPWSSLFKHVRHYSSYGLGFTKPHVFAAGGGPAYYVRADHWEKQKWDDHVKTVVTPFWPAYRPKSDKSPKPLGGNTFVGMEYQGGEA